ncbi:MAG: hypothetical protein P8Y53_10805 [Pseudolabrys sp.]|jgi:hypothetical protein
MQFAIMVWTSGDDSAKAGSIFGVMDAANPTALPPLSPNGLWSDFGSVNESHFKFSAEAKKAIDRHGYFLLGASVTVAEAFGHPPKP